MAFEKWPRMTVCAADHCLYCSLFSSHTHYRLSLIFLFHYCLKFSCAFFLTWNAVIRVKQQRVFAQKKKHFLIRKKMPKVIKEHCNQQIIIIILEVSKLAFIHPKTAFINTHNVTHNVSL